MQWKLCGFGIEQTPTHILDILLHSFYLEVSIIKITEQRNEFNLSDIYSMCGFININRQQTRNPALKSWCRRGWTSKQNGKIITAKVITSIHSATSSSVRFPSWHRPSRHELITQFKKFNPLWPKVLWAFQKCFSLNSP